MANAIPKANPELIEAELNYRRNSPREKQTPPNKDWFVWLIRAGRGFGKTFSGSRWLHSVALNNPDSWMALIGKTPGDVRDDCVDGPGGIMKQQPPEVVEEGGVEYEPSKRRIQWPNGSYATIYSGANHDQIRGFSGSYAWCDEFAAWDYPEQAWDNLMFGMREGNNPRVCITTTPRPIKIIREIETDNSTVTVTGSTYENEKNLNEQFLEQIRSRYEGTSIGQQEIHAEYVESTGLWNWGLLEQARKQCPQRLPDMESVAVAIDPAVSNTDDSDETGIIVAGKENNGYYVMEDCTLKGSPNSWASEAVNAYHRHNADCIVAEVNQGGDMVEQMVRQADSTVNYEEVRATRGKEVRAQPVVALYERAEVYHTERFEELESQLVHYSGESTTDSPDRMDALVWALSYLTNEKNKKRRLSW